MTFPFTFILPPGCVSLLRNHDRRDPALIKEALDIMNTDLLKVSHRALDACHRLIQPVAVDIDPARTDIIVPKLIPDRYTSVDIGIIVIAHALKIRELLIVVGVILRTAQVCAMCKDDGIDFPDDRTDRIHPLRRWLY